MIRQIEHLLKQLIGLEAESVGRLVIERAVRQRMQALELAAEDDYWKQLERSSGEQQALVEAVVVPETWFFRYPESFVTLVELALKRKAALAGSRALRVLSLPCSSGEEPYSIVMALLDAGFAPAAFQVDALDVSARVVELARLGHYGRNSFRGQELGFRERYFEVTDSGFQLQQRVRDRVQLRCGNLLDSNVLGGEAPFDFVFCRNLLIYFDRPTQNAVLDGLQRLLHADGTFFVGPAEASLLTQRGMQALGAPLTFAFKRAVVAPVVTAHGRVVVPEPVRSMRPEPQPLRALPAVALAPPAPAVRLDDAASALARVVELADAGRSEEALQECERYLLEHGPSADAFYWLALLNDMADQGDSAQAYYRKALYLEPEHVESLVHLATLLAARGDHEGAKRLQLRVSRANPTGMKRDER
ncbi:putative biofilm formation methyltransferase WspC [Pseudomonas sp. 8BK]|uniref:CheR family methyltransferase n=1 Tax=Pseudomonas sp. 8BK TaxID=2653164 RepID=UPI0012F3C4DE|nr:CheR family methyltransferase [Pseudomonas sp. 8BK]VXC36528.1 putative biofilm formation methyltransferase WspC [Pseudomonas sp. 8BK]